MRRSLSRLMRSPYEILGVPSNASLGMIKDSFREKAKKCHPDLNPGDASMADQMAELSRAYDILSDEASRAKFDAQGQASSRSWHDFSQETYSSSKVYSEFSDIFNRTQVKRTPVHQRGDDISTEIEVSFLNAMKGCQVEVSLRARQVCGDCTGSGAAPGTDWSSCPTCFGSGTQRVDRGILTMGIPCTRCRGSGQVLDHPCSTCRGSATLSQKKKVPVKIPPGIRTGMEVRVLKEGHCGERGGRPGNLFVTVKVQPHETFRHIEDNIHSDIQLSLHNALLGGEIQVDTLEGPVAVKIPPRTFPGTPKTLANRGPPKVDGRGGKGHHICHFYLKTPKILSARQIELIKEFDELERNME